MPTETGSALLQGVSKPASGRTLPPNPLNLGGKTSTVAAHLSSPKMAVFHATPAELAPGDPRRIATLNMIAHHISAAVDPAPFAQQLKAMNVTPEEEKFVNDRLAKLAASTGEGVHGLVHHAIPTLYKGAVAGAALLSGVGDVKRTMMIDGKPVEVHGGMIGGFGPAKGLLEGEAVTARTAEGAAHHVSEAARTARAQGHGAIGPHNAHDIPLLKAGEVTPETGGETGTRVREALVGAPKARTAQENLYSAERTKRAGKVADALKNEDPHAALQQALGHLKGELPKIDFQGFKEFDHDALTAMLRHVQSTPVLRDLEKVRASEAIHDAIAGKVPTKSDQLLLERAFGRETGKGITRSASFWKKAGRTAAEIVNVPRAFQAAFDLSAPFRQGLVVAASHPRIFFSGFKPMLKAAKSEDFFQELQQGIRERPTFPLMDKAKLSLTDIGTDAEHGSGALSDREEQFMSNLAERIPGIGHGVRVSDRAYVGFLNKMRADVFDDLIEQAAKDGVDLNDDHQLESIGKIVNAFTGRGDLGKLQAAAPLLNSVFFSPRLLASRLNLIFGVGKHGIPGEFYMELSPFARKQALVAMRNLVGTTSLILWLAKLSGADVNLDPTNADFGKIKIGDTRLDILGGFQQPVRLFAQIFEGHITSSTTGKAITLTQHGFGKLSRKDIIQRFIESKFAPVPSTVNDLLSNKNFQGQPLTLKNEAYSHLVPLLAQDLADLERQSGPIATVGGAIPATFGVGLQTYAPKAPKSKSTGSSSGFDSNIFDTGSGGSSKNIFDSP